MWSISGPWGLSSPAFFVGILCKKFGERHLLALSSFAAALSLFILGISTPFIGFASVPF